MLEMGFSECRGPDEFKFEIFFEYFRELLKTKKREKSVKKACLASRISAILFHVLDNQLEMGCVVATLYTETC